MTGVHLSRSRPYQKNDNRYVEQKNDTLVRQYLGELRLDTPEQIAAGNALYEWMWLYYNLFQPVMHLCETMVDGDKVGRKCGSSPDASSASGRRQAYSVENSRSGCRRCMSRPTHNCRAMKSIQARSPSGRQPSSRTDQRSNNSKKGGGADRKPERQGGQGDPLAAQ